MTGQAPARVRHKLLRMGVAVVVGLVVALIPSPGFLGPVLGWTAGAAVFCLSTWWVLRRFSPDDTARHASQEDPSRALTDLLLILSAMASVAGVGLLLSGESAHGSERLVAALTGTLAVAAAWFTVPTLYTARYADLYYTAGGRDAIDFGDDKEPSYADFAYLAFTLSMTYQVSDTALKSSHARLTALRQSLLSWFFGAVVLASVVNLVSSLASS